MSTKVTQAEQFQPPNSLLRPRPNGVAGLFVPWPTEPTTELVQHLQEAKQALKLNETLIRLDKYRFLIIDDIGYVSRDQQESSVLFELIAHRYERASLIITANQPFSEWHSIFADKSMTVAAVDRLIHHAHILELQGESYRKTAAKNRANAMNNCGCMALDDSASNIIKK